jgi:hypothetical protein
LGEPAGPILPRISSSGTVASHPARDTQPFRVAPTTEDTRNTFGLDLVPVACLSLNDILFEFDSSFVRSSSKKIFQHLPELRNGHKSRKGELPPLSVFGHADPVGTDEYNKQLSGRRAKAVYGVLTHDVQSWLDLINHPFGGDDWNAKKLLDRMRAEIGDTGQRPADAVVADYQAFLNADAVPKSDFLGRGSDSRGTADFQGCGEFNPLIILSKSDKTALTTDQRDEFNQPDRRVVVFLFRAGLKIDPSLWPCPRADQPTAKCRTRFFVNSADRLAPGDNRRELKEPQSNDDDPTVDTKTFACRFYDRIARLSPCERILRNFRLKLFDPEAVPLPFAPFVVLHGSTDTGRADQDAVLTVPALTVPDTATIKWSRPLPGDGPASPDPDPNSPFDFQIDVFIDIPDEQNDDKVALERLHNLGYVGGLTPADDIADFQNDYKSRLPASTLRNQLGKLDDPTKSVLQEVYNSADPVIKKPDNPGR